MDLPTYTNIWRIEKPFCKLYDFRLPAPLPITWTGIFTRITVPYVISLIVVGLPFIHNLVCLYVLPSGVLTWLTTRPVIDNKQLPELVSSQLRYIAEPRTWCRMAPDVIADPQGTGAARTLKGNDYQRLAHLLAERYPLTMIHPTPSGLTRLLYAAGQQVPKQVCPRQSPHGAPSPGRQAGKFNRVPPLMAWSHRWM